jgi:anthranilate phosphoribosyltransferase
MILRDLLRVLGSSRRDGRNLTGEEAYSVFASILAGEASEIRIGAFLIALRWKGVTVEEISGFARAARDAATIPCRDMEQLVCVCPPHDGQERHPPLEVAAGLIAAAAGTRVLIVSDRCVPPKRGLTAASVLEALGTSMSWDPREAEECVVKSRFGVVAATGMLPALLGLRRVRSDLGVRTPLATIEKLIAPSSAALVVGAWSGPVLGHAIEVVQALGHRRGAVIQGVEGGICPSLARRARGVELADARQAPLTLEPADFGLACERDPALPLAGPFDEGRGAADCPALLQAAGHATRSVLAGGEGPARSAALLAAAVLLKAGGVVPTIADGIDRGASALDSGEASAVLERYRASLGGPGG